METRLNKSCSLILLLALFVVVQGCAMTRQGAINQAIDHIGWIETIATDDRPVLSNIEGVALLSFNKIGMMGCGLAEASATVFVKNPETKQFGPPAFADWGGISVGLIYGGLDIQDCLLLFDERSDAIDFAKRFALPNFSFEASFLTFGTKMMLVPGASSHSDGAGLSVGALEIELLFGGARNSLHKKVYLVDTPVDQILLGKVNVPDELKSAIQKLNTVMGQ